MLKSKKEPQKNNGPERRDLMNARKQLESGQKLLIGGIERSAPYLKKGTLLGNLKVSTNCVGVAIDNWTDEIYPIALETGRHFIPFARLEEVSTLQQAVIAKAEANSYDGIETEIEATAIFRIDPPYAAEIRRAYPNYTRAIEDTFRNVIQDLIEGNYAEIIYRQRHAQIKSELFDRMQEIMEANGFVLDGILIKGVSLDPAFEAAIKQEIQENTTVDHRRNAQKAATDVALYGRQQEYLKELKEAEIQAELVEWVWNYKLAETGFRKQNELVEVAKDAEMTEIRAHAKAKQDVLEGEAEAHVKDKKGSVEVELLEKRLNAVESVIEKISLLLAPALGMLSRGKGEKNE